MFPPTPRGRGLRRTSSTKSSASFSFVSLTRIKIVLASRRNQRAGRLRFPEFVARTPRTRFTSPK